MNYYVTYSYKGMRTLYYAGNGVPCKWDMDKEKALLMSQNDMIYVLRDRTCNMAEGQVFGVELAPPTCPTCRRPL